jgi:hypothetical protein
MDESIYYNPLLDPNYEEENDNKGKEHEHEHELPQNIEHIISTYLTSSYNKSSTKNNTNIKDNHNFNTIQLKEESAALKKTKEKEQIKKQENIIKLFEFWSVIALIGNIFQVLGACFALSHPYTISIYITCTIGLGK